MEAVIMRGKLRCILRGELRCKMLKYKMRVKK